MKKGLVFAGILLVIGCHNPKIATMNALNTSEGLTKQEKNQGWQLLFDGHSLSGWHGYGKTSVPKAWKPENGVLHLDPAEKKNYTTNEGGDIVTDQDFDNFDLKLEWRIAPNGNS